MAAAAGTSSGSISRIRIAFMGQSRFWGIHNDISCRFNLGFGPSQISLHSSKGITVITVLGLFHAKQCDVGRRRHHVLRSPEECLFTKLTLNRLPVEKRALT